jgi:hypothetical protein
VFLKGRHFRLTSRIEFAAEKTAQFDDFLAFEPIAVRKSNQRHGVSFRRDAGLTFGKLIGLSVLVLAGVAASRSGLRFAMVGRRSAKIKDRPIPVRRHDDTVKMVRIHPFPQKCRKRTLAFG